MIFLLFFISYYQGMLGPYDEVKERLDRWTGTRDTQQTRLMLIKKKKKIG